LQLFKIWGTLQFECKFKFVGGKCSFPCYFFLGLNFTSPC
jgi:hypothetical protein